MWPRVTAPAELVGRTALAVGCNEMADIAQNTNNTTIRYEKKIKFVEQPIGPAPDPETADPDTIDKYYESVNLEQEAKQELFETVKAFHACKQEDGQSNYNMHSMGKTLAELHAMLKLHEKGIPKKAETPAVLAIRKGNIQKDKKNPQGAKGKAKGNPKTKILPSPKRHNLAKDTVCHHYKEGLRRSRKLKHGALSLYMGNGMRTAVEAIRSF
ncbi:hypothetical protein Tco_0844793 [Tanacetum coccineum]